MLCSVSYFISAGRCFCMLHYFVAMDGGAFVQPYALLRRPGQYSGNQYLSGRLGRLCRAGNRVEAQQVLAGRPEILPWSDYVEATADTKTPPSKHTQNCNFLYKTHALTFLKVKKSYHFCRKSTTFAARGCKTL